VSEVARLRPAGAGRMVPARERIEEAAGPQTIGPMVWELEGPMPILKTSKTDRNMPSILDGAGEHAGKRTSRITVSATGNSAWRIGCAMALRPECGRYRADHMQEAPR
jgi:hypothetical protein